MIMVGTILKTEKDYAVIMTDKCEIFEIKKQPGMYEGLEISFGSSEIIDKKRKTIKYSSFVASVAAVFIFIFLFSRSMYFDNIYAYVDVDVNYSVQFKVDSQNRVLDIKVYDESNNIILNELDVKSKPINDAILELMSKSEQLALTDKNDLNIVLVSTSLQKVNTSNTNYYNLLTLCDKALKNLPDKTMEYYIIDVNKSERKIAESNKISMGRYIIYEELKERGIEIKMDNIRNTKISKIVKDNDLLNYLKSVDIIDKLDLLKDKKLGAKGEKNEEKLVEETDGKATPVGSTPLPSKSEEQYSFNISDTYDFSAIQAIEVENEKVQKQIESVKQQIDSQIEATTKRAQSKIDNIRDDSKLDMIAKLKAIQKIQEDYNKEIDKIGKSEEERLSEIINSFKDKTNNLIDE